MIRWGYTGRRTWNAGDGPIRHKWDGLHAKRRYALVHAVCGAALRGFGPRDEPFDPTHPRACKRCTNLYCGCSRTSIGGPWP